MCAAVAAASCRNLIFISTLPSRTSTHSIRWQSLCSNRERGREREACLASYFRYRGDGLVSFRSIETGFVVSESATRCSGACVCSYWQPRETIFSSCSCIAALEDFDCVVVVVVFFLFIFSLRSTAVWPTRTQNERRKTPKRANYAFFLFVVFLQIVATIQLKL